MPFYIRSDVMQGLLDTLMRASGIARDSVIGNRIEDMQKVIEAKSELFEQPPEVAPETLPLPYPTAVYLRRNESPNQLSEEQMRGLIVNPMNVGMLPGTTALMPSDEWIRKVAMLMRTEGIEQTLVNMITMIAQTLLDEDVPTNG